MHFQPCMVHVLHRSVVPVLHLEGVMTDLFRASNAMRQSSYQSALLSGIELVLGSSLVVCHHYEPDPRHQLVSRQVMEMTFCQGRPQEQRSTRMTRILEETLSTFVGDWTSDRIRYLCRVAGVVCVCVCVDRAVNQP